MLKLLKLTLPLFLLFNNNLEIAECKITNNYKSHEVNTNTSSVELHDSSLNPYNIDTPTEKELEEFWKCIDSNKSFENIALQLSESLLRNHFNNIKKFNYKYIKELEDTKEKNINTWSYFCAMQNALQEVINNIKKDNSNKEQLVIKNLLNSTDYGNQSLNDVAFMYLYRFYKQQDTKHTPNYKKSNSTEDIWANFDALGFDKIFYKVVKGTLKIKHLLQPVEKDKKQLQLNNKELNDNYDKEINNNSGYFIKLENHDIGICWLDTAFEIIYNSILNTNDKDIKNTNFYKFIKFLEQKQKSRDQEVKKKNGKEVISKTKKTTYKMQEYRVEIDITHQISILEAFDEFEKQMKKEELETWNNDDNVKKAKDEIHNLIKKHNESKQKKNESIQKYLQDKLDEKEVKNNIDINKMQQSDNSSGNNATNGIKLLISLFPELKKIFVPQYSNKKEKTNKNKKQNNNKNTEDSITCGNLYENEVKSFDNFTEVTNYGISTSIRYETRYSTQKEIITGKHDTLTKNSTGYITSFPEYIILNGYHYGDNKNNCIQGMKFDENLNEYIVGFNKKSELVIYEISSMAMSKSGEKHAYSLYKGSNGWYIMDDHNKYYKLKPEEFKEIIGKDKVETFVYKQLYCNKIDVEENKKQSTNSKQDNNKESKKIKQQNNEKKKEVKTKTPN